MGGNKVANHLLEVARFVIYTDQYNKEADDDHDEGLHLHRKDALVQALGVDQVVEDQHAEADGCSQSKCDALEDHVVSHDCQELVLAAFVGWTVEVIGADTDRVSYITQPP